MIIFLWLWLAFFNPLWLPTFRVKVHPFLWQNMPQKVHFFLGKFIFHHVGKKFVFMELIQNIFQVLHMFLYYLGVPRYHQYKWSRIQPTFHGKQSSWRSWTSMERHITWMASLGTCTNHTWSSWPSFSHPYL